MVKDIDDKDKEPARRKAERRWSNYDIEKRLKEQALKEQAKKVETQLNNENELAIADTISNEKPDGRRSIIRPQTKFAKEIRTMLEGHTKRNLLFYKLSIRAQRYRLLKEKLRRLEARQAQQSQES